MAENTKIIISAVDKTKKGFGSVGRALGGLTKSLFSMRTALVGVAGVAGFGYLIKSSLSATDSLAKTASKIGTTTEALSALRYAADITGVATTTMDMALQRFTRRTAEAAKGTGEAKGAIRELGINAQQLNNMPLDQKMLVLADAFSKQTNESNKLALAFKLFDSEGAALVNTLSLGREGLAELLGEAKALGVVMSSDAAQGVEDASDALTRLKAITKGLKDQFVAALAPAVESLTTEFTEFFKKIADEKGGVEQFAKDMAISFLNATLAVVEALNTIVTNVGIAFAFLQKKVNAFKAQAAADDIRTLTNSLTLYAKAMDVLNGQGELTFTEKLKLKAQGVKLDAKSIADAWSLMYERLDEANGSIGESFDLVDWSNLIDVEGFKARIESLISLITGGGDGGGLVPKVVKAVTNMRQAFVDWKDVMPDVQEALRKVATQGADKFTDAFTDAITGAKDFATAMKDMAKSIIDSLIRMLVQYYITKPLFDAITGGFGGGGGSTSAPGSSSYSPSFAGGGFTGMGSRSGGVDGKGGFPAILHPNETVIDHTKGGGGGGGGGVVVNQTINVTTGIQSTVRAEIVQLMPQIAQAAKGAVADARLRGGNFSKAMAGA
jgi:hypothetical protein